MSDTIYRQQAIGAICRCQTYLFDSRDDDKKISLEGAKYAIEQLPSAQPVNYRSTKSDSSSQLKLNNDLISRQALCEYALNQKDKSVTPNDIMRFPSAQPQQKKGHWIGIDGYPYESWECDQCGCVYEKIPSWTPNFCPSCGADMRGESDE